MPSELRSFAVAAGSAGCAGWPVASARTSIEGLPSSGAADGIALPDWASGVAPAPTGWPPEDPPVADAVGTAMATAAAATKAPLRTMRLADALMTVTSVSFEPS